MSPCPSLWRARGWKHLKLALLLQLDVAAAAPRAGAADARRAIVSAAAEEGGGLDEREEEAARALDEGGEADEAEAEVLLAVQPAGDDATDAGVEGARRGEEEEVEAQEVGEGLFSHVDAEELEMVQRGDVAVELRDGGGGIRKRGQ